MMALFLFTCLVVLATGVPVQEQSCSSGACPESEEHLDSEGAAFKQLRIHRRGRTQTEGHFCPGSGVPCSGDQCCPGIGVTSGLSFPCPADPDFQGCQTTLQPPPGPEPGPEPGPPPQPASVTTTLESERTTAEPTSRSTTTPSSGGSPTTTLPDPSAHAPVDPDSDDPVWGCGLLGDIPGISPTGQVNAETQRIVDVMKRTSTFGKVSFWNWNLAPMTNGEHQEYLSSDFIFMPENWGAGAVEDRYLRPAMQANFKDDSGRRSPATMGNIFLGMNEPDIAGSCMGNMFGKCVKACTDASVAAGDCPASHLFPLDPPAEPNANGECNCWQFSYATGVGFWPFPGCADPQPLPKLWESGDEGCIDSVMSAWHKTAAIAYAKGYKFLSTPLQAYRIDYAKEFIERACGCVNGQCSCTDASCGCPAYVGFHFYAYDCRPESGGSYASFRATIEKVGELMEQYDFIKGAIVNEIGMLNCRPTSEEPICMPNSGDYPANDYPDHQCPSTDELPNGMASFMEGVLDIVISTKTSTGRGIVKGVSWFNANMAGGTYNLQLFNGDGSINSVGEGYMRGCSRWASTLAGGA